MKGYPIQGPKVIWKAAPADSHSTRTELLRPIVTESQANEIFEQIIGENNLKPIAFLDQGITVSKSVAHITKANETMATGFLITPDVLLTNWHVFKTKNDVQNARIRFNYLADVYGNPLPTDEYDCDVESLFRSVKELDYAVVRIRGEAGTKWGYLKITPIDIKVHDKVNIIQHPGGGPKKIAMNDNEVKYVDESFIQYITDTMPGSSGAPVFNDAWQVVALHHSGGNIPEPSSNSIHFLNEGIRIGAIAKDLPSF